MPSTLARVAVHTLLFVPSVALWLLGGWLIAALVALWISGHGRAPLELCLAVVFYPVTGWVLGVGDAWRFHGRGVRLMGSGPDPS